MSKIYDLIIIGSGPAGLACASYAARANLKVLIIEGTAIGGKLAKIAHIENYPGIIDIDGATLANDLYQQALSFGAELEYGLVNKIENGLIKKIITSENTYETRNIVIATGTRERRLKLKDSDRFTGKGISYCATCDGFFFRKKDVCVIGENDQALEECLYLSSIVNKVYLVIDGNDLKLNNQLTEKIKTSTNIEIINNSRVMRLENNDDELNGLWVYDRTFDKEKLIECKGIFPYIGVDTVSAFLPSEILDENGYILVDDHMQTNIEGIYAAGDCLKKELRQIVTAASDGAIAAATIIKNIRSAK